MSFEGWYQIICENGHLSSEDCYDFSHGCWKCEECGKHDAWTNLVDVTNGSFDESGINRIDGYLELAPRTAAIIEECHACGHAELKEPAIYSIVDAENGRLLVQKKLKALYDR